MVLKHPKVSIVVPVYNKEAYLPECLDSILRQTLREIEVVSVDDGSTDDSLAILKRYARKDDRIKVESHEKNRGIIQTRKSALIAARGEFAAFVDADDFVEPELCKAFYHKAVGENADFVQCNARVYDPDHILTPELFRFYSDGLGNGKRCTFKGRYIFRRYTLPIRNNVSLSFVSERVYKKVIPFIRDDAPKRGDDDLLSFFFTFFARKYVFLDRILYNYRANETSSNLNHITLDLAKSQIQGRAAALQYAKWFAKENGVEWKSRELPFSAFSKALVKYSADFMDRYIESGGKEREEVIRYFGDCFGGDALWFFMEKVEVAKMLTSRNSKLLHSLYALYSSILNWRLRRFLKWGFRLFRVH